MDGHANHWAFSVVTIGPTNAGLEMTKGVWGATKLQQLKKGLTLEKVNPFCKLLF